MKNIDFTETIKRYNKRIKELGFSEEALGWTRGNNLFRMNALVAEWKDELNESSIFDFGCGFGDFCGFLETTKTSNFKYFGIDINPTLIAEGQSRYPHAKFITGDIHSMTFDKCFDFVFSSGVFNHKLSESNEYEFILNSISRLYEITNKGLAVNFLSDKVEYQTEHNFNANPGKILEFCYGLTNNIVFRNDYMPFEFTIYLRKDKIIDRDKLVFI